MQGFRMDAVFPLSIFGIYWLKNFIPHRTEPTKPKMYREPWGNLPVNSSTKHMRKQISTMDTNLDLTNIDHVPSSGSHSGSNAMLYLFEDYEVVMRDDNQKGRCPTMRHVSRTHRGALDWLFDRINLGFSRSKSNMLTQGTSICWHVNQR